MGMAASQARYLGLAARKTNCEYQGQQINQARTALGNQSAELWNQMLGLSVPTAPNTTDYAKTQYSFTDGQNDFEITSMIPTDEKDGYNYSVKYKYYEQEIKGIENINTNPQVQAEAFSKTEINETLTTAVDGTGKITYDIGGNAVTCTAIANDASIRNNLVKAGIITNSTDPVYSITDANGNVKYVQGTPPTTAGDTNITSNILNTDQYKVGNSEAKLVDLTDTDVKTSLQKIAEDNPGTNIAAAITSSMAPGGTNTVYTYQKSGVTYYASKADLEAAINSTSAKGVTSEIDKQDPMKQYYTSQIKVEKVMSDYALLDDASGSGRFTSIKLEKYNTTFGLNTETTTNEEEYQNALNQYYYDTQQYEKTLADINARTELIQQEDRTLELRLKQLDTEHNALQTEMEAVKKVVDKNVEDTFKTFNG